MKFKHRFTQEFRSSPLKMTLAIAGVCLTVLWWIGDVSRRLQLQEAEIVCAKTDDRLLAQSNPSLYQQYEDECARLLHSNN